VFMNRIILPLFSLLFLPQVLMAAGESRGIFRFSEFSLSPRAVTEEPRSGGFDLKESWIGFEWKRDEYISGELSIGSSDLIAPSIWHQNRTDQISLVAANVLAKTDYFDIRAGLINVPNGYEGAFPEWERQLPETRARARRWFTKRDYGMELKSEVKPFLTSLTVYNGESGANLDQKLWATGLWRYLGSDGYGFLSSATVGRTDARSSSGSVAGTADEGFLFDPNVEAKIRYASLALFRKWKRHLVLLEAGKGDILQNDQKQPFNWQHADVSANLGGDLNLLFRIEHDQTNDRSNLSLTRSYGFGFSLTSEDRLSSVMLWGQKNQEDNEIPNDQLLLQFRLNSNSL
jgi:hypothetical protein